MEICDAMYDVQLNFSHNFWLSKYGRGKCRTRDVATLQTKYDTGRDLFTFEALAAPSTFFEFSSSLGLLLSSYISHHKDESKRKLARQQDDSIDITKAACKCTGFVHCTSFEHVECLLRCCWAVCSNDLNNDSICWAFRRLHKDSCWIIWLTILGIFISSEHENAWLHF